MDIKLKNKYVSSKYINLGALILAIYLLAFSVLDGIYFWHNRRYISLNPYFKSDEFYRELNSIFNNIMFFHIEYKNYSQKTDDEKVDQDELNNMKYNYDSELEQKINEVEDKYSWQINQANEAKDTEKVNRLTKEREEKIQEVKTKYTKTIDDIKKELIQRSDKDYENLKKALFEKSPIKYYIKDGSAQEIYTNIENLDNISIESYIKSTALYSIKFPRRFSFRDSALKTIDWNFDNRNMEGYFIVPKESEGFSQIHANFKYYNSLRKRIAFEGVLSILALVSGVLLLKYLKKNSSESFGYIGRLKFLYKKLPIDVNMLILVFAILYILGNDRSIYSSIIFSGSLFDKFIKLSFTAILILYLTFCIPDIKHYLKNTQEFKNQWRDCLFLKIRDMSANLIKSRGIFFRIIIFLPVAAIIGFILGLGIMAITNGSEEILVAFIFLYCGFLFIYVIRNLNYLNKIILFTDEIAAGNFNYTIEERGKGLFARLAHNINNLQEGIRKSLESQMKSDKLKSELITNVSHDLKTPLTSIINYVDLLKKEDLSKEEMQGYVSVLDRKAQRLKVLIEDLFEASKMASGSVELNIEKVDVAQLLNQALAEFEEKIKSSSLTFKVNIPHHKVYSNLDGKKTWRVFENLIGNILKYSQPKTRVYIDLYETETNIIITMKNISAYEMDFNPEELFERFKRGDTSRNTEGSGLGLAIAKSIVNLQGGKLNIEIDGDLFKAIVEFNK